MVFWSRGFGVLGSENFGPGLYSYGPWVNVSGFETSAAPLKPLFGGRFLIKSSHKGLLGGDELGR